MQVTGRKYLLFVLAFALLQATGFSQSSFPLNEWVKKLRDKDSLPFHGVYGIADSLRQYDSATVTTIFNQLEKKGASAGDYFDLRLQLLRATWIGYKRNCHGAPQVFEMVKKALDIAYRMNKDSVVSEISWTYGGGMYQCKMMEYAAIYCLLAAEEDEKIGRVTHYDRYMVLGAVLYNTRDYEKSIYYTRRALTEHLDTSWNGRHNNMSLYNTIGLCWQKIGNYDSAFFNYDRALHLARINKNTVWEGIISGNMGQIYFAQEKYDTARAMLEFDYRESKAYGEWASAANSLQWLARINLAQGKKDSALIQVREAISLLQSFREYQPFYMQNVYYALTDVYRSFRQQDSVLKYSQLYTNLHDSIERAVADSRLEIARIKLDNLQHVQALGNLQRQKNAEKLKRNFIIAIIVLVSIIIMFYINRLRLKHRHNEQLALQQKQNAEIEIAAAKEQLQLFTQNIIEKTAIIEKLQEQRVRQELGSEQLRLIDEISHQTILTEDDWQKFKSVFEKIYPGFFARLREKAPDITVAEQRMAAVSRLHLNSKEIASILGISADSVRKAKLRLRQRLGVSADEDVEELLSNL